MHRSHRVNLAMNTTGLGDIDSMLACVPVCAKMGFEHIVVALWSLLGVIVTGISTVVTAHYRLKQKEIETKMVQHNELMKLQTEKLELTRSMSPKSHTPPSTNDSAHYLQMNRLLTMFTTVGANPADSEPTTTH